LGKTAPLAPENGTIRLEILADRMSIEIFANGGRIYMPMGVDMAEQPKTMEFVSEGGDTLIETMDVYPLRSIWF
jgi:fructan beta-fructosidase